MPVGVGQPTLKIDGLTVGGTGVAWRATPSVQRALRLALDADAGAGDA